MAPPLLPITRLLLSVLLLASALSATMAQQYRATVRRYGVEDGLPHRQVNSIVQDQRGFIWAATNGGVVRFDGRRFKVFNQSESGLGSDEVNWVSTDRDGYIWARGRGADVWLRIIEPVSGKIIPADTFFHNHPPPLPPSAWDWPPLKIQDGSFVINILDSACLMLYHPDQVWRVVPLPDGRAFYASNITPRNTLWGMHVDRQEHYTLLEIDLQGHVLNRIPACPDCHFRLMKGETTRPGGFFVIEGVHLKAFTIWEIEDTGHRTFVSPGSIPDQYARIKNGDIDIHFPKIYDRNGQLLLDLGQQFPELDPTQYFDYLLDRNGNIWFATAFGLIVIEMRKTHFRKLLYDEKAPGGRGKACRGLLEKNGRLIVNTELEHQGRFLIDTRTREAQRIPGEMDIGIAESSDGHVWTHAQRLTDGFGYTSLEKITLEGQPIGPRMDQKRINGHIWTILEDNPRRVLLGHTIGASVYDPSTGILLPWHDDAYPEFDQSAISWLGKDRSGQVWACTSGGLYSFQPNGRVAERFWPEGKGRHYLPYSKIYHFYEDPAGIIWLGTGGGGLIRWDRKAPEGQQVQVIFRKNGLLNGVVYAVYEDKHEHLWLPTDYGIAQLDKKALQVRRTWLVADGLTHNEFNRVSHCQGADGSLYFGGLNGVTAFHPDDFYEAASGEEKMRQSLVVSDFSVWEDGSDQLVNRTSQLLASNTFTIYPDNRYIELEFALLEYMAPEKVTYTWKLEGISADWEPLQEPVLRLSNLPYGSRRLLIRAQAADGTAAENELDIRLVVMPPFYLRWWFIFLSATVLVFGIWVWQWWRTREHRLEQQRLESEVNRQTATIRHQTEELSRLDQAKSRFFANVSHELRTPLTLILGPLSTLLKGGHSPERSVFFAKTAHQHGQQLLHLVNEILDLSKMESGKMKLHETTVSLQPFLKRLVSAFESHADRLGILFVYEYQLPERLRVLVDEDKLQKVMNNLLSNALKFTPAYAGGTVGVQVSEVDGQIRICVHDTGRGIHPDDLPRVFERFYQTAQTDAPIEGGAGIGLALCREFADLLQGRIWATSEPGQGSRFYFEFPKKEVMGVDQELSEAEDDPSEASGAGSAEETARIPLPPGGPMPPSTILLVEDNEPLRDYVKSILSDRYRVITAANGVEALDFLNAPEAQTIVRHSSFLILSDIMMPVMDGFQLLEALKGDDRWRHIPVVMLTARADIRDKLRALRIGVDDYLLKPFEEEELLVRVENLLKNAVNRRYELGVRSDDLGDMASDERPEAAHITHHSSLITPEEAAWLEDLEQLVNQRLGDFDLTAEMLAEAMAMSRATFFRQLRRLTGLTPGQYLDEARYQKARSLLENREAASVKSAAYAVGFRQVKHFSQNYKKRFGKLPSEFGN